MLWTAMLVLVGVLAAAPAFDDPKPAQRPLWLVVTRPVMVNALQPLVQHREAEGFEAVVSTLPVAKALETMDRRPAYILLVGDDGPGGQDEGWYLAARAVPFYRWRRNQPFRVPSDAVWGDLDADGLPDIPVGRIPARTPLEVTTVVRKILSWEARAPGIADLRIPYWSGSPMYGGAVDEFAVSMAVSVVENHVPSWLEMWLIAANPNHALCGWPPDQPQEFARSMKTGGIFGALMGHGGISGMTSMDFEGRDVDFDIPDMVAGLGGDERVDPPLVVFTCHSGNFTTSRLSLTEAAVLLPGGPVAAVGATSESHPLPNYFSGVRLAKALADRPHRFGDLWLTAQLDALEEQDLIVGRILREAEGSLEPDINEGRLRRDQTLIYALMGDPATRLKMPAPLEVDVSRTEDSCRWTVRRPPGAELLRVGWRDVDPPLAAPRSHKDAESSRKAFALANARLAYQTLHPPLTKQAWEGNCTQAGRYRFVAEGTGQIWATALELR